MRTGCCEYFTSCILARSCTDCLSEVPPMRWSTKQGMNMHRKRCTGVFSAQSALPYILPPPERLN